MYYEDEVVSIGLEARVVEYLDSNTWLRRGNRRIQCYGYMVSRPSTEVVETNPIPQVLMELVELLDKKHMIGLRLQCLVNEYKVASSIKSHRDPIEFNESVAVFSLLDEGTVVFTHPTTNVTKVVDLRPRSLLVFEDSYATDYLHSVPQTNSRSLDYRRISITFRAM